MCLALLACIPAFATSWKQPTPDELKMTADPAAPDAPAVYLDYEEIVDDVNHFHHLYARIKILNEKGKEDYSDIQVAYEKGESGLSVSDVQGRTIEPDGSIVPFTGKPYTKQLIKSQDENVVARVFTMPDVRVGSILEYQYTIDYEGNYFMPPRWFVQQPLYIHHAHFHFTPEQGAMSIVTTDAQGHQNTVNHLIYFPALPTGVKVREGLDGFDLVVNDVPALPNEDFMPPVNSFSYRLFFYYSPYNDGREFWKAEGKYWSKDVDRFASPDKLHDIVAHIVAPGDTDDQKLSKIYAAVMTIQNTDFTRQRTSEEAKAEGLRNKTAADIWAAKVGTSNEIDRLFIGLARAAGFKAYDMITTQRDDRILNLGYLDWSQLSDEIAIVSVGGKEQFFDPGERYCEYGKLAWVHTQMLGVRQTDDGTDTVWAPGSPYTDNSTLRTADLTLGPDGKLQGQIRLVMNGVAALRWRQRALSADEDTAKKDLEKEVQNEVPAGVQVKMSHFLGLTDSTTNLMAVLDVSGGMGTVTGKRLFMPASFFEAGEKPLFAPEKRENPIDLRYPYIVHDVVTLNLSPGLSIESAPQAANIPYPHMADFVAKYSAKPGSYQQERLIAVANTFYHTTEYPQLRTFFQSVSSQDQQQLVLRREPVAVSAAAAPAGSAR